MLSPMVTRSVQPGLQWDIQSPVLFGYLHLWMLRYKFSFDFCVLGLFRLFSIMIAPTLRFHKIHRPTLRQKKS